MTDYGPIMIDGDVLLVHCQVSRLQGVWGHYCFNSSLYVSKVNLLIYINGSWMIFVDTVSTQYILFVETV